MPVSQRLFGTDGVRGVANTELTCDMAYGLGRAAVRFLGPDLVIGKDTRRSGAMLEAALMAGIMSAGGTAHCAGVIPTPAVALLTREKGYDGGVVISASHNPPRYNGIKFFDARGYKLDDATEQRFEDHLQRVVALRQALSEGAPSHALLDILGGQQEEPVVGAAVGKAEYLADAHDLYISHAVATVGDVDLTGLRIAVDCGHGASCQTTPEALRRLGAEVHVINDSYDGDDINVGCGSTDLEALIALVLATRADLGIAHDGDADRLLAVDADGTPLDGDIIEAICAVALKARGQLAADTVVSTVMSNLGFKKALAARGIAVVETPVGDRYVLQAMVENGYTIGGEQSGHMIFLEHNSTGDGLVTALQLIAEVKRSGSSLAELAQVMTRYPQVLINVAVTDAQARAVSPAVRQAVEDARAELGDEGRVLVRASGTEPLVRVMVEAADEGTAKRVAQMLVDVVEHKR
jgi:phosphoglucosamine mutase